MKAIAQTADGAPDDVLLVPRRVCDPAGMHDTGYLRSDELPGDAAIGYLSVDGPRTNVFHLPVRRRHLFDRRGPELVLALAVRRRDRLPGSGGRDM